MNTAADRHLSCCYLVRRGAHGKMAIRRVQGKGSRTRYSLTRRRERLHLETVLQPQWDTDCLRETVATRRRIAAGIPARRNGQSVGPLSHWATGSANRCLPRLRSYLRGLAATISQLRIHG